MNKIENRIIYIFAGICLLLLLSNFVPGTEDYLASLLPWLLAGSFLLSLAFHRKIDWRLLLSLACIGVMGFFISYAALKTGIVFGQIRFGKAAGPAWQGVPFFIGMLWASLVFYASCITAPRIKNIFLASLAAALLMTGFDFLLEPSAMRFHFWHWRHLRVPVQNYLAWFGVSLFFQLLYNGFNKFQKNRIATAVFLVQAAFFGLLLLWFRYR